MKPRLLAVALLCCGCVPYQGELPADYQPSPISAITDGPFPGLDPGASQLESLHFKIMAYGGAASQRVADTAEAAYTRIMTDTGLYSFKPRGLYQLVVYANQDEYRRKTGQPDWSAGLSVGNAIYTFDGPHLGAVLSHEMTHLIWFEYMGRVRLEQRWINEGLAVYEESRSGQAGRGSGLRAQPMSLDFMMRLVPATEKDHTVSAWYAQAESMVRFMIERGGRMPFSTFLAALRDDKTLDRAIGEAFTGNWRNWSDFEAAWLRSVQ